LANWARKVRASFSRRRDARDTTGMSSPSVFEGSTFIACLDSKIGAERFHQRAACFDLG